MDVDRIIYDLFKVLLTFENWNLIMKDPVVSSQQCRKSYTLWYRIQKLSLSLGKNNDALLQTQE